MLDYKWVKKRNIKDVMQLPIDIWIKGKQAESTLGVELKKLGIEHHTTNTCEFYE